MSTLATHFSVNEALPESVRAAIPDAIAQTIFRSTLNTNLEVGKSEMRSYLRAYRALEEAGYEQKGNEWVAKESPTVGEVHIDAPLGSRKKKPKDKKDDPGTQDVDPDRLLKADKVAFDVPLFIRLLEMAREEIKSDEPLHVLTEKIIALAKEKPTLDMGDYNSIVSVLKGETSRDKREEEKDDPGTQDVDPEEPPQDQRSAVTKRISGNSDIALNGKGRILARRLAQRLKLKGGLDALYSSNLVRAVETADAVADADPNVKRADPCSSLNPWHLGKCEGQDNKDVKDLIKYYVNHPDEKVPGTGADGQPGESFNEATKRLLTDLSSIYKDSQEHPTMKVGIVMHGRGMSIAQAWADEDCPLDFELKNSELFDPDDPDHADVLRWHKDKIKKIDLDSDDELKPGVYLILHSLTDDDTDEGNPDLEKREGEETIQTVPKYLPPLEVHQAAKSAYEKGAAVMGITAPLAESEGLGETEIRMMAQFFASSEAATVPEITKAAWGGPMAVKWAARVIKKIERDQLEKGYNPDQPRDDHGRFGSGGNAVSSKSELAKANPSIGITKANSTDGVMVCFYLNPDIAKLLALDVGEDAEDLHLTLAYLGKKDEINRQLLPGLESCLQNFAVNFAPLHGTLGGPVRFNATEHSDGKDVVVASFTGQIQGFRKELCDYIDFSGLEAKKNLEYTPHVALAYIAPEDAMPVQRIEPVDVTLDKLVLCVGGERKEFPLTGETVAKAYGDNEDDAEEEDRGEDEDRMEEEDESESFKLEGTITKLDQERHLVYGWFSITEIGDRPVTDTQGDIIDESTLEDAMIDYVLEARKAGSMHETNEDGTVKGVGRLIECVVFTKEKQRVIQQSLQDQGIHAIVALGCVGAWGGFKIDSDDVWDRIKSGALRAFSVGGRGKRASL